MRVDGGPINMIRYNIISVLNWLKYVDAYYNAERFLKSRALLLQIEVTV